MARQWHIIMRTAILLTASASHSASTRSLYILPCRLTVTSAFALLVHRASQLGITPAFLGARGIPNVKQSADGEGFSFLFLLFLLSVRIVFASPRNLQDPSWTGAAQQIPHQTAHKTGSVSNPPRGSRFGGSGLRRLGWITHCHHKKSPPIVSQLSIHLSRHPIILITGHSPSRIRCPVSSRPDEPRVELDLCDVKGAFPQRERYLYHIAHP
ncbi:hypothetical protein QBC33DRAFT_204337 [Phialemonium atrogriseum]|uniref:Secreted protein n=1 Tax=Phialemonium atrogriseum TaxID=1093897 RepID=A0AAJ0FKG2_9PEZI|nr:uncharacterized protein QBC33DRAFT_204337 [Phialemonium atrogriseum]KAK1764055.1 hypothetical protein QBC33DRAFT_204337 [Phialemonium atrogriseum]